MAVARLLTGPRLTSLYRVVRLPLPDGRIADLVYSLGRLSGSHQMGRLVHNLRLDRPVLLRCHGSTAGELIIGHPEIVGKQPRRELVKV